MLVWFLPSELELLPGQPGPTIDPIELMERIWDALRAQGHNIGDVYVQHDGRLFVVVDDVAMKLKDAEAVAKGWVTVPEVAAARGGPNG